VSASVPLFEYQPKRGATTRFVDVASRAHVCGASGCVESADLVLVERQGERRVLCTAHAQEWST